MSHSNTARPRARLLVLSILVALPAACALAQDEPKKEQKVEGQLETITVTAQRREEDVQKVPISITTIEPERIDVIEAAGDDIRVLSGRLPSLNIESSFGRAFPRFYIRGLGNTDFDLNASQPVSLVYDEIVQESAILKGFPIFDLDRIEVLRGPQGTLFGRNTPAGVLKFESRRPAPGLDGYARINYGTYSTTSFEGAVGGGLSDTVSGRASVLYQRRNDWVDNDFTNDRNALEGYREFAARGQLLYAGDDFEALFNVHARDLDGTARLFRANIIRPGTNDFVSGFDRGSISIDGRNEQNLEGWGANARLRWDFDGFSLYSVTGFEHVEAYSRGDIDGGVGAVFAPPTGPGFIPFSAESADGLPEHHQVTQEFRIESRDAQPWDWQVGLFYFDEHLAIDSFSYDSLAGGVQNGYAHQEQDNTAWALFGSAGYAFTDTLKLRAGLRYTHDEKEFVAQRFVSPLAFLGVGPIGPLRADPDDSDVSGDLALTWAASDTMNYYARLAKGFRAPSIQGRILFGDVVSVADSERVVSFEVGMKAELWDKRARLGFDVFRYDVHDQQLTAVGGQQNFNTLINADKMTGQGVELDFEAYVTDRFLVTLGYSYNDTEIKDRNLAVQPCASGCTVLDPVGPVPGTVLIDGNRLPQAPKNVFNVTARYDFPVGEGQLVYVSTDWAYRSEVNFFLYESKEYRGDPLLEGGLRIGYTWDYGQYEFAAFGRNITDREELVGGIDFNNLTGFVNEPRIVGLEFKAKF
jgi:iron complex outermembrane receptor protein